MSTADAQRPQEARSPTASRAPARPTSCHRDEHGRIRTKILVQKRSYLDGGTEVMPGDIQTNRTNFIDSFVPARRGPRCRTTASWPSRPITDPFFLPGKNNPFFN